MALRGQAELDVLAKTLAESTVVDPHATIRAGTLALLLGAADESGAKPVVRDIAARSRHADTDPGEPVLATLPRLALAEPGHAAAGTELVLREVLGAGGMGAVWLAEQRSLGRDVAVKRLHAGATTAVPGLVAEARATGALEHPNIVPVHLLGVDDAGSPLLVMKRISGTSLEALLADAEHPEWARLERRHGDRMGACVEVLMRVADALHFAHCRGIVHRDVKPANVMVGEFGEVYLVDWGIALRLVSSKVPEKPVDPKHTRLDIVGTPAFMAPEMARGDNDLIDARTDVYLLGATLHAAITGGRARHDAPTVMAALVSAMRSEPITYAPNVPEDLAALCNRATSASPDDRPATSAAFHDALALHMRRWSAHHAIRALEARLAATGGADGAPSGETLGSARVWRDLVECRFGLVQALAEWPESTAGRAALQTTLRWMAEAEIHRRSPDAAALAAAEMDPRDATLDARIDALRAELVEGRRLEAVARAEERERDLTLTARPRAWMGALLVVATALFLAVTVWLQLAIGRDPTAGEIVIADLFFLVLTSGGAIYLRRSLFVTRVSRQAFAAVAVGIGYWGLNDLVLLVRPGPFWVAAFHGMLGMSAAMIGAALVLGWRYVPPGLFVLGGALVTWTWPSTAIVAPGVVALLAASWGLADALFWSRPKQPS